MVKTVKKEKVVVKEDKKEISALKNAVYEFVIKDEFPKFMKNLTVGIRTIVADNEKDEKSRLGKSLDMIGFAQSLVRNNIMLKGIDKILEFLI